jgi:hypothetical protein
MLQARSEQEGMQGTLLQGMSKQAQTITKWLFWAAFGIFLAVSIPHIAWVFRQYEPQNASVWVNGFWWVLAFGFAIAIDAMIGWLSYIKSVVGVQTTASRGDGLFVWVFILVLVAMSWYLNWVFSVAHDPSRPDMAHKWWTAIVLSNWESLPTVTIGQMTPILLSALPVFIIAYTFILSKVARMKAAAAKTLQDLQREADEAEQRAIAERRIREAQRSKSLVERTKEAVTAASEISGELKKRDPHAEMLDSVLQLFQDAPGLLSDENASLAETAIRDVLHLKKSELATLWRKKAMEVLSQKQTQNEEKHSGETLAERAHISELETDDNDDENGPGFGSSSDERIQQLEQKSDHDLEDIRPFFDETRGRDTETLQVVNDRKRDEISTIQTATNRATGSRYITFEDASVMTGYAVVTLKRKVSNGDIERHPTDKNRVKVSSLRSLKRLKRPESIPI